MTLNPLLVRLLSGAFAGTVATAPMTAFMTRAHRLLPPEEKTPLPPAEITAKVTEEVGLRPHLDRDERRLATLLAHYGYGAACGALYAALAPRSEEAPVRRGVGFGLAVWAVSYLGLLPALGLLPPATKHPARRNALMIAAHVVFGAALGLLAERLEKADTPS